MHTLIVGGRGLLGSELFGFYKKFYTRHKIARTVRGACEDGDYLMDLSVERLVLPNPFSGGEEDWEAMFLVAAVTGIMACETDAAASWRVNADAPVELARQASLRGIFTVFVSSDAVSRSPRLNYSMQKSYVESFVLATGGAVMRPSRIPREGFGGLVGKLHCIAQRKHAGVHHWNP